MKIASFKQSLAFFLLALLVNASGLAQHKNKIKYLVPTGNGSTGLFNAPVAWTLRPGEITLGLGSIQLHREPGDIDFTLFPVSVAAGLHDRIEFFASWDAQRRVHADGIRVGKTAGGPIIPARLLNEAGTTAYFNDLPFLDVGFASGPGELRTGIKVNLLSEGEGRAFSLAIRPILKLPLSESRTRLLRGMTNGAVESGPDLIITKDLPRGATLTGNIGYVFVQDSQGVDLQNRLNYSVGYEMPFGSEKMRFIGELVGSHFPGDADAIANPRSPLDIFAGLRLSPSETFSISTAYALNTRTIDPRDPRFQVPSTNRSGWFFQLSFHRKINRPPTVECQPAGATIAAGESVSIRLNITDTDDDFLSLLWRTPVGMISEQGTTAMFDSTGVRPGAYTIMAEVSDGEHTASCSTRVRIETQN